MHFYSNEKPFLLSLQNSDLAGKLTTEGDVEIEDFDWKVLNESKLTNL